MSVYRYFRRYVEYGVVTAKKAEDNTLVPENSFYKSVRYVDNVLGPVKDVICGVESKNGYNDQYIKNCEYVGYRAEEVFPLCKRGAFLAASIILQPLCLILTYLSYFPVTLLSKVTGGDLTINAQSLIDHSNVFLSIGQDCASAVARVFNKIVSYACAAIIWAAASIITPLVWACNKVQSKLSEIQKLEKHQLLSKDNSKTTLVGGVPRTEL